MKSKRGSLSALDARARLAVVWLSGVGLALGCSSSGDSGSSKPDASADASVDSPNDADAWSPGDSASDAPPYDGSADASPDAPATDAEADSDAPLDSGPSDLLATGLDANAFVRFGGTVYFSGKDATHGTELWVTDTTPAGTHLVDDSCPGSCDGYPIQVTAVGSHILFGARHFDGDFREVFALQASGPPTLLKTGASFNGPRIDVVKSVLLFAVGGTLWGTDGTSAGTTPGLVSFGAELPESVTAISGTRALVVVAQSASSPSGILYDLFSTDGTTAGTYALEKTTGYTYREVRAVAGGKGFVVSGGTGIYTLLISDGTFSGTTGLIGGDFTALSNFTVLPSGKVVFGARPSGKTAYELWASDGTPAGTTSISPNGPDYRLGVVGADAYTVTPTGDLIRSDGTSAGTSTIQSFAPKTLYPLGAAGSLYYFFVGTPGSLPELWKTDGTPSGTALVKALDVCPAAKCVAGYDFIADAKSEGSTLVLSASVTSPLSRHLWATAGSDATTHKISDDLLGDFQPMPGGVLFGTASTHELRFEP